ncbi:MAG: hypothetical protein JRJ65_20090 [Deltaproteobacteria bacterium]|nr:hypothetical protein [Deltaproteobacteria bacterium]
MKHSVENKTLIKPVHLEFLSPGPINLVTTKLLNKFHPWITASVRAIPAPDHIHKVNRINVSIEDMEKVNKANSWKMGRVIMPKGSLRAEGNKALDPREDVGMVDSQRCVRG